MDTATAQALIALNNRFYAEHAASFSATRSAPWEGWKSVVSLLRARCKTRENERERLRVLDLASGNLRFEKLLARELPDMDFEFHAVDSCPALVNEAPGLLGTVKGAPDSLELADDIPSHPPRFTYHQLDILESLSSGDDGLRPLPPCDLSVSFGFMHHVPSESLRRKVLGTLLGRTAPGGIIVLSFWQFMNDDRLARKARRSDGLLTDGPSIDPRQLDPNDHFLGWQSDPSPLRYCHHFDEREIDELVASVGTAARELARYSADGSSGTLNRYLVLERIA